jgi:hypothetical protein
MPDFCTCGAELPADALFCHKCGKPQRSIAAVEPAAEPEPALAPLPIAPSGAPEPMPLNFHNAVAVRTALVAAAATGPLSWIPFLNIVLSLGAGFFAAFFYGRRTGSVLDLRGGLRIGWITAAMVFPIAALIFTGLIVLFNLSGAMAMLQTQGADPRMIEAARSIQRVPAVVGALIQLFVFISFFSMVGGAIGAAVARGQRR